MGKDSLLVRILGSVFFKKAQKAAGGYVGSSSKLYRLVADVIKKLQEAGVKGTVGEAQLQVMLMVRMVKAYASGEYRDIQMKSIVSVVAVLVYFVSPIDFIPDFLPVIGITDDLALIIWLVKNMGDEVAKFADWEKKRKVINIG